MPPSFFACHVFAAYALPAPYAMMMIYAAVDTLLMAAAAADTPCYAMPHVATLLLMILSERRFIR